MDAILLYGARGATGGAGNAGGGVGTKASVVDAGGNEDADRLNAAAGLTGGLDDADPDEAPTDRDAFRWGGQLYDL